MPALFRGADMVSRNVVCVLCNNLLTLREGTFRRAFLVAAPCCLMAGLIKYLDQQGVEESLKEKLLTSTASYASFTFLISMLMVFRTSQSYQRYWDGCDAAYMLRSDFFDAVSSLFAFCRCSTSRDDAKQFQHLIIRLFSMMHALMLAQIESHSDIQGTEKALSYEVIDAEGLDRASLSAVETSSHKVELVFQWIQSVIVQEAHDGVLNVPAPLLTRSFQELNSGMSNFNKALKIAESPFPFPYTVASEICLIMHWVVTPLIVCTWTGFVWGAVLLTFMQVFVLWVLHGLAIELEDPFGEDHYDLHMAAMQKDVNQRLLMLLEHGTSRLPTLSDVCKYDVEDQGDQPKKTISNMRQVWKNVDSSTLSYSVRPVVPVQVCQETTNKHLLSEPVRLHSAIGKGTNESEVLWQSSISDSAVLQKRTPSKQGETSHGFHDSDEMPLHERSLMMNQSSEEIPLRDISVTQQIPSTGKLERDQSDKRRIDDCRDGATVESV